MSKPRILLTRRWPQVVEDHLAVSYDVTLNATDTPLSVQDLRRAMGEYDALCPTVSDRVDRGTFDGNGRVRIIANYGAGYEHIDLAAAAEAQVLVTNTPDVLTESTAELAIFLMLAVARRVNEGADEIKRGVWSGWRPTHLVGQTLVGRTLGLVGFGRIAQATARRAKFGLGMNIQYFSRTVGVTPDLNPLEAVRASSLDDLVSASDVLSLHCPGGPETRHLINSARLSKMKSSAILVNTARGSVIDESALVDALVAKQIFGAGLDVYESEPTIDRRLLACSNAVLLPHLGSATDDARIAMGMRVAANLDAFFAGRSPGDRLV